ncbi:MAG: ABC transporter substrate-binding protein [Desulfatitalea sp.]|nr:ABC transporter substrate-binding protein [Desulfatitalea sp.]
MRRSQQFALIVVFCVTILAAGTAAWGQNTIRIGVIGPMQFSQGQGHWNGAVMAAEELNGQGGVKIGNRTLKIELIKADSNEFINLDDAAKAMAQLLTRDKADIVVGGFRTEAVMAMQDVAMDAKKIFIGVGAAHPELCNRVARDYDRYKYFFRSAPFNSSFLVKATFVQMRTVASLLRQSLGIDRLKIAIVAEQAMWADPMVGAAENYIPRMGMEVVGVWRPSPTATDVSAELSAIQRANAHMVFTIFSSPVGVTFARQAGELKIPTAIVGINVEAQKDGFWEATQGKADYLMTMSTYSKTAEYNDLTRGFVDGYVQRFGETPTYTADTYTAIKHLIAPAITTTGSLDPEKIIPYLEDTVHRAPSGKYAFMKDEQGRHLHDLSWGPGLQTSIAIQWQNGRQVPVWPHFKWMSPQWEFSAEPPATPHEMSYKGIQPYVIAPWVIAAHKK